jgi:SNF2 family DNA or RNA helicase
LAVVAQLAITKALRLQQITSGYAKTDDGKEYGIDDNPRLRALESLLEEITKDNKVIIWACFRFNYAQIGELCQKMGIAYRALHGDIPTAEKQSAIQDFRSDPTVKVMIANQASAGVGVNLQEASYSIFYSRNFSLENDLQAEARNYRGGTELLHDKVTRIDLISPNTIDELIATALALKQNVSDQVLGWKI